MGGIAMRIVLPQPARSVLYENVSWEEYEEVLAEVGERPGLRIAYDRGRLEIVSPGTEHEGAKSLLRQLVEAACDLLRIEYVCLGSLTMLRPDLFRGVEPDECYYIANARRAHFPHGIDLRRDPPPDLVIEVDVSSRSLSRFPIYHALGIQEVWSYRKGRVESFRREEGGEYEPIEHSISFPWLRVADLSRFVETLWSKSNLEIKDAFRAWVRTQI